MAKKKQSFDDGEEFFAKPRKIEADTLFYFRVKEDYLRGILCGRNNHQLLHYDQRTYFMKVFSARQNGKDMIVKAGQVVEFPANVWLRRIIEDNELVGSRLRIIFQGKRGRYKFYSVRKDIGTFVEVEEEKHAKARRQSKAKKRASKGTGTGRKWRRPKSRD